MKVVIAHPAWGYIGGGRLVDVYVAKILLEREHEVIIASCFNFNKDKYREWFGIDLRDVKVYKIFQESMPIFGIYQRLLLPKPLKKAIKQEKPEIVFTDSELYKPALKLKREINFRLFEYIHFPFHALKIQEKSVPEEFRKSYEQYLAGARLYHRKYERGFWKIYFKIYLNLYNKVARENPFEYADTVMVNSHYVAKLTNMLWNGRPYVLYPPVMVNDFKPYAEKSFEERENSIVMIGRVSPEKRIEDVIDAIALSETKPTLKVIGGIYPHTLPYKNLLIRRSNEKRVKIEFYTNIPRKDLIKIATSSKIFVHSTICEHFGIAVVEGMAAGCPVIVHKSGGPYEDITNYGEYGLLYENLNELAENIDKLMTSAKLWRIYHEKALSRSLLFNEDSFKEGLIKIMGI